MTSDEVKGDRRYTKDHEWAKVDGDCVVIGVTAFAVGELGDITLVNIDVKPGDVLTAGKAFGTVESTKTLSDLFAPVSGKVHSLNKALDTRPELVNEDCYEVGWMLRITPSDKSELEALLEPAAYAELLKTAAH